MPIRNNNFVYIDRQSRRRPLRTMRAARGARLYDLIVPKEFDYEVVFRMRGQVPQAMVSETCTRRGLIPHMEMLGADLFMHCFERRNPTQGMRNNYRVNVIDMGEQSDDSSFEEVDLDQESEIISRGFDTTFD